MSRILLAVAATMLAPALLHAAPVQPAGGKGVVFPFPAKAPVVVSLNGYDKARERLTKLLSIALPNDAQKLTKRMDEELDHFLKGRTLTAVRKDARIFLVVNDLASLFEDQSPPLAVLVPVTSYKAFRESFLSKGELKTLDQGREGVDAIKTAAFGEESPAYMVDLKDYVALTLDKTTAEAFAGKYVGGTLESMGSDLSESFLKADLAVYVNMDAVNDQFGDQIRAFKGLIDFGLQQAVQQGALPGFSKKQMEAMKVILKGAFQGVEDCRSVVMSAEFKPDGLVFRLQARFVELSPSGKLLALETPEQLPQLAKLPTGLGIYTAAKFGRTIAEVLRDVTLEFSTTDEDVRGAKLIEGHLKDLAAAGHQADFSATTAPGLAITISQYKDPEKAVRALTKTYKAIAAGGKVNSAILKTAPRVTNEAATHRDLSFTEVRLSFDYEATVAGLPEQVRDATLESLKRAMKETTIMWIGTDGKNVLQLTADDWTTARALLDKYLDGKSTVGLDAGFKSTRAQLPSDVNYLLIAETGSAIITVLESIRATGEVVPGFPKIPALKPLKGEPTYVGLSVTLKGDTATVTGFVPVGAIAAARKLLDPLFKKIE